MCIRQCISNAITKKGEKKREKKRIKDEKIIYTSYKKFQRYREYNKEDHPASHHLKIIIINIRLTSSRYILIGLYI